MMKMYFGSLVIILTVTTFNVSGMCLNQAQKIANRGKYNPNPDPPLSRELKEECRKKGEIAGRGPDFDCDITCESVRGSGQRSCKLTLVNRCFCPKGMLRTTTYGDCVTLAQCPGNKGKHF